MQREIVLTGGFDSCVGIEGFPDTFPMPSRIEKPNESDSNRFFRTRMAEQSEEMQSAWWMEAILERLTDLKIFGDPFQPGDILHLSQQDWEGVTLPECYWMVADGYIEPEPYLPD